jgi:hypothetical protein
MEIRDIVRKVRKLGIATGSRAFGVNQKDSDYDYVISYEIWKEEFDDLIGSGIHYNQGYSDDDLFQNFFIENGAVEYDLIVPYEKNEFEAWKWATKVTKELPEHLLWNKWERVAIFEGLKEGFRNIKKGKL